VYLQERVPGTELVQYKTHPQRMRITRNLLKCLAQIHNYDEAEMVAFGMNPRSIGDYRRFMIEKLRKDKPIGQPQEIRRINYTGEFWAIWETLDLSWRHIRNHPLTNIVEEEADRRFVHGSFHPKNILLVGNPTDKQHSFRIIDWELAGQGVPQDDLVRILEGPITYSEEEKRKLLTEYFWEYPPTIDTECNEQELKEFLFLYHAKRLPMHLWAALHLQEKGVPRQAKVQLERSFDSLDVMKEMIKKYGPYTDITEKKITAFEQILQHQLTRSSLQSLVQ